MKKLALFLVLFFSVTASAVLLPLHDPYAIHWDTFTSDTYVITDSNLTMTNGTFTANMGLFGGGVFGVGAEKLVDPSFDDNTKWDETGGWDLQTSPGQARSGTNGEVLTEITPFTVVASQEYAVEVVIPVLVAGAIDIAIGGTTESLTTTGTHRFILIASDTTELTITNDSSTDARMSSLSVKITDESRFGDTVIYGDLTINGDLDVPGEFSAGTVSSHLIPTDDATYVLGVTAPANKRWLAAEFSLFVGIGDMTLTDGGISSTFGLVFNAANGSTFNQDVTVNAIVSAKEFKTIGGSSYSGFSDSTTQADFRRTVSGLAQTISGSGLFSFFGDFSFATDLSYKIEITTGGNIGTAIFRWSDDGGSTWDEEGVTTTASPYLMNNGLYAYFEPGAGADFVTNDFATVTAIGTNNQEVSLLVDNVNARVTIGTTQISGNQISNTGGAISLVNTNLVNVGTIGATTITGSSFITGSDIGIGGDTDLLQLTADLLTVNGGLVVNTTDFVVDAVTHRVAIGSANGNQSINLWHDNVNANMSISSGALILNIGGGKMLWQVLGTSMMNFVMRADLDQNIFSVEDDGGNQLVFCNDGVSNNDFDHAVQTNPTFFIHSDISPAVSNNQWGSFHHDQEDFIIETGAATGAGSAPTTDRNAIVLKGTGGTVIGGDGANETLFAADGLMTMTGTARVLKSVDFEPDAIKKGGVGPADSTEDGFPIHDYDSTNDESVKIHWEIPHSYASGGEIHIHVEYFVDTAPVSDANVTWGVEYKRQSIGDNLDFDAGTTTVTVIDAITTGTPANDKKIHSSAEIHLTTTGFEPMDVILIRIFRDANAATDNFGSDARVFNYHLMYLSDKLGQGT